MSSERRTSGDLVAVAVIVVVVLIASVLLWRFSDARATVSQPAVGEAPPLTVPTALPPSLGEAWSAPSAATPTPVVAGSTVVTADGREVVGRDPFTGATRWRYARDIDLCTVTSAWSTALTVWSKNPRYCSEVTAVGGDSGRRVDQRNGDAEHGTRVLFDGTHATAIGQRYLETWRSDLVRTTQYGAVPTPVNPGKQPRSGCTYISVGVTVNQIGLVERCPSDGDGVDRLTVLKANPKEAEQPEVLYSVQLGVRAALVVAMSAQRTAVLLPGPRRLAVYDEKGNQLGSYRIDFTTSLTSAGRSAPAVADITVGPRAVYWFTGSSTVALDPAEFRPLWTVEGTLGSGVLYAGRLLVPTDGRLAVLEANTGQRLGETPVDRGSYHGPVQLSAAGPVVLEQRGSTLVALR
ncbi:MAG TPA: PQQ-binding-like beta-propeller repeat protein [Pseudonocardiaceae bacterium]